MVRRLHEIFDEILPLASTWHQHLELVQILC